MPFAAALSVADDLALAIDEVSSHLQSALPGQPHLAVAFFSPRHHQHGKHIAEAIQQRFSPQVTLGCIAESVIGNDREIEDGSALSVWVAHWSGKVQMHPFHLTLERTADGPSILGWPDALWQSAPPPAEPSAVRRSAILLLGDPHTFPTDLCLNQVNENAPHVAVLGGMASGFQRAGDCRLLLNGREFDRGAVGLYLHGDIGLRSIVSQGCRPIGRHMIVTKVEENLILELGGRSPLDHLRDLWPTLSPEDQALFQNGLHLGRVLNEYQGEFQRGDFLIRNVLGLERQTGALAVADHFRVGQTVQFQVRDAASADEDLHALLQLDVNAHDRKPAGALLFSCNGRGTRLFPEPNHDARVVHQEAGPIPLAGFFAQGELGPVGGRNFIHGFTASIALFEE